MNETDQTSRRVVITGMGIFSPIGIGIDPFWKSLSEGKSGVRRAGPGFEFFAPDCVGGIVSDFTEESAKKVFLKDQRKNLKAMCREIQLGVASASQALQNSGLDLNSINHERLGVEFGANLMLSSPEILSESCMNCVEEGKTDFQFSRWGQEGLSKMEPLWLLRYLPNMPACHISISSDARGPSNSLTLDDASGNTVLGEAMRILLRGNADMMITGGTGTTLHVIKAMHLALWRDLAVTPEAPEARCRPFDQDRAGRVVGEGACTFILEERSHAESRGAKIWAELLGTGSSCVFRQTGTSGLRPALVNAMKSALKSAGLTPDQIGHINAQGVGTREGDIEEAKAILEVFGQDLGRKVPVTAIKSLTGNSGAGAGTIELAA
ncbi:MAG: beta-ketoacyl-[acyl-carrier-protein] synthase family protein, partial [Planctomycetes bacterium]|nr:beta-ketoacyl-[acyl-carrier-protein] synthase family protein [Planctomycetota bacterium]